MKRTFAIFLLFSLACTVSQPNDLGSKWRTGTEAVAMSFMQDNPSSELLSSQEMSVVVQYSNKGAYDIDDLRFYLTGYDPTIILMGDNVKEAVSPPLTGKNQYNPEGSQVEYITWEAPIRSPADVDSFKQDLTVTACYRYQTLAAPNICIDPKKYDFVVSSRCNFDIEGLGGSQGGPVAVTNIRTKTTDSKVYLEITIENKGSGIPFTTDLSTSNCFNSLRVSDIDTIKLREVSLSGRSFSCKPSGNIRLTRGKGLAVCELPISGESYYVSPLRIDVSYNYRQDMSRTVNIVNVD